MKLYTVDEVYVNTLNKIDSEVYYNTTGYDRKPYIGIIVVSGGYNYFIPLSSAKPKHKTWKNVTEYNYLVYEFVDVSKMTEKSIYVAKKDSSEVKHIVAVLEIRKMIPVPDGLYHEIDIAKIPDAAYRDLLKKEYRFLKPLFTTIQKKANNIYQFQIKTGKVFPLFCDFRKLETICDTYTSK